MKESLDGKTEVELISIRCSYLLLWPLGIALGGGIVWLGNVLLHQVFPHIVVLSYWLCCALALVVTLVKMLLK